MPTEVTTSVEQVGGNVDGNFALRILNHPEGGWMTPKFLWLLLMIVTIASTSSAQPTSGQRSKPTINRPGVVAEADTRQTILQKCAEVDPDASFLIPKTEQFGSGRIEASGSGAYAYKPAGDCRYWVVDFLMNRSSHTWVSETGQTLRGTVNFHGAAFDLPSSENANATTPIVEEDCKRLELDVIIYRKDPNENTFKMIKSGRERFSWDNTSKRCNLQGLMATHSERAPTANMLKIRIAVRVKLRGSWQQAAGYAIPAPPN